MATRRSLHSRNYEIFRAELKRLRKNARITQVELAKRLNQPQTYISKCERGERRVDMIEVRDICRALRVDYVEFARTLETSLAASKAKGARLR